MGGLAALAREAGHQVTGCDANVYPPMSDQLRALGIELIEGYGAEPARAEARPLRHRQRRHARQPADRGDPRRRRCRTPAARSGSPSTCCRAATCSPSPARTARPPRPRCSRGSSSMPGSQPGFLVGGVPLQLRRLGAPRRERRALRDRGRRVRHRVLRQAQQVRPLPAAHRGAQQPRVRPRRHLRRPRPRSSASSTTSCAPCRRSGRLVVNAREEALQRVLAMGCWSEVQRFGARKEAPGDAARARRAARLRRAARQPEDRPRRVAAARRAQPAERAGRDRRRRARRRRRPRSRRSALASFENVRRRLELRGDGAAASTVYDDFAHHPTAMRTTVDGPAPQGRRGAHPRGLRAALEHHEARRDEGAAAVGARGSRPRRSATAAASAGTRRRRSRRWARRPSSADSIDELVARVVARPRAGRPRAVHEQRRLRRRPREAARRARRRAAA